MRTMRARKAFTLVELLVVIGIIALLISILLPALSAARSTATNLVCVTHLRQIAQAVFFYQQDNRGRYPICSSNTANVTGAQIRATWSNYFLAPYLGNKPGPPGSSVFLQGGYHDSPIMRCPVDDAGPLDPTATNYWGNPSYSMLDLNAVATLQGSDEWIGGQTTAHGGTIQVQALAYNTTDPSNFVPVTSTAAVFPRGDNPYIIEGVAPQMYHGNGPNSARIQHGVRHTKMNYISVDLSVMQIDFKDSNYKYYYPIGPGFPWSDPAKYWDQECGTYQDAWTPTHNQSIPATSGGAYIAGWPYYAETLESGPLTHAVAGYKY